jgi:uncharacterized protein YuzE
MALVDINPYINLLPQFRENHQKLVWMSYDEEADVLYINFRKPSVATDSELTDDDILIRYDGDDIIGYTVLNAARRMN